MADIKEAVLQQWFTEKAVAQEIQNCISLQSVSTLRNSYENYKKTPSCDVKFGRAGAFNALQVHRLLGECDLMLSDRNIANSGETTQRPDLVLESVEGHYILVELKTREAAERQGVQELLAYYATLREQAPYAVEIIFVVVACHWTSTLRQAVKALILDGKKVLPLKAIQKPNNDFDLEILTELFNFHLETYFEPWEALCPATLHIQATTGECYRAALKYLKELGYAANIQLKIKNKTGFIALLEGPVYIANGQDEIILALVVATVNQHWSGFRDEDSGIVNSVNKVVHEQQRSFMAGRDKNDIWDATACSEIGNQLFKPTSYSYKLIERLRKEKEESCLITSFNRYSMQFWPELCHWANLSMFYQAENHRYSNVYQFMPLGELSDSLQRRPRRYIQCVGDVFRAINDFSQYKKERAGRV